jgi:hypothetical protein
MIHGVVKILDLLNAPQQLAFIHRVNKPNSMINKTPQIANIFLKKIIVFGGNIGDDPDLRAII